MPIDIIGGSGFIATRLVQRLLKRKQLKVKIIDKIASKTFPELFVLGDVRSIDNLRASISQNSVIVNLAAEHRDDVYPISLYDEVNVTGAENVCKVANEKGVKTIIFTSSVAVYGFSLFTLDESGAINFSSHYGRTKWEAEQIYKKWYAVDPENRTLVIVRPTVVFGESNRGNVFNLLRQIATGKFVMIGDGLNRKSMAYVENVAAFLEHSLTFSPGIHIYNYIDKPDFSMRQLVGHVNRILGRSYEIKLRLPYTVGIMIGKIFDVTAKLLSCKFSISAIRVKKFCANSVFESSINKTGFVPPVNLMDAIEKTVRYEFIEEHKNQQ
jgi:nucleoside-diphosphate-sugar epimerase